MLDLTNAAQQLIAQTSVVMVGAFLAVLVAALLVRQLDLYGIQRHDN